MGFTAEIASELAPLVKGNLEKFEQDSIEPLPPDALVAEEATSLLADRIVKYILSTEDTLDTANEVLKFFFRYDYGFEGDGKFSIPNYVAELLQLPIEQRYNKRALKQSLKDYYINIEFHDEIRWVKGSAIITMTRDNLLEFAGKIAEMTRSQHL